MIEWDCMEGIQTHSNLPRSAEVMSVGWGRWAQSVDSLGVIASLSHILEATRREHRDTRYSWGSPMSWPDMNRSMYLDYAMACMDLNRLEIDLASPLTWLLCGLSVLTAPALQPSPLSTPQAASASSAEATWALLGWPPSLCTEPSWGSLSSTL